MLQKLHYYPHFSITRRTRCTRRGIKYSFKAFSLCVHRIAIRRFLPFLGRFFTDSNAWHRMCHQNASLRAFWRDARLGIEGPQSSLERVNFWPGRPKIHRKFLSGAGLRAAPALRPPRYTFLFAIAGTWEFVGNSEAYRPASFPLLEEKA